MSDTARVAASWHANQVQRVTTYNPKKPELPGDHRCGANCMEPPPPPPVSNEGFRGLPTSAHWLAMMGAACLLFVIITRTV